MSVQSSFEFSGGPGGLDDVDVSPSNAAAIDLLKSAPDWPFTALCLIGPPRSGLTLLLRLWTERFGARILTPDMLSGLDARDLTELASGYVAVDDVDMRLDEGQLLFLLNQASEKDGRILLTSHTPLRHVSVQSRDLASRLAAMPLAEIGAMDGDMFTARLTSQLARYRLAMGQDVAAYLGLRLERTYADVEECVRRLAGETGPGQGLTVPLARSVLDQMYGQSGDETGDDGET